ncbi:MAG TPA: V-type ATP synthase subunit E family protein, partial [Anaerolineales bacterium]|nr:V-type ATP synthase subunit E family protein [Anaerolineales bacterium]
MKTEVEDIGMLSQAILHEARDEAEQIKAEAKEKADAIRKRTQEQAASERQAILDRAKEDAERIRSQVIATAQLKARSLELEHREKLLDGAFEAAKKQLDSIKKRPDYDSIVASLLREAVTQLKATKAQVRADDSAQKSLKKGALDEISKELNGEFTFGAALDEGIGVVV